MDKKDADTENGEAKGSPTTGEVAKRAPGDVEAKVQNRALVRKVLSGTLNVALWYPRFVGACTQKALMRTPLLSKPEIDDEVMSRGGLQMIFAASNWNWRNLAYQTDPSGRGWCAVFRSGVAFVITAGLPFGGIGLILWFLGWIVGGLAVIARTGLIVLCWVFAVILLYYLIRFLIKIAPRIIAYFA